MKEIGKGGEEEGNRVEGDLVEIEVIIRLLHLVINMYIIQIVAWQLQMPYFNRSFCKIRHHFIIAVIL